VSEQALFRLTRPRIRLVALCHPETFPLPRFPLGISDLARAIRLGFQGEVTLSDMQLGLDIDQLVGEIAADPPDILGVSATFGQHDLLERLVEALGPLAERILLVFGGSLCALNAERLLGRYPSAVVATGPGEAPIRELVEYWHGDRPLCHVVGIRSVSSLTRTGAKAPSNSGQGDFLPELDLLEETLDRRGVMQLEASRGCTHACSFCPREHKGIWAGEEASSMAGLLPYLGAAFDARPALARKIFLVDEEFVGYEQQGQGLERARSVADTLWAQGFHWETSSRVDQVYRPDRDSAWHVERMKFWAGLRERGLDRCLFGLESGVDSVLRRFNKHTTARQNVIAVRLLTACAIPIRCTYITFDPLMSPSELLASYQFQGRGDLILLPQTSMAFEELLEAVQDDGFATAQAAGRPLHATITYMLVSMECLLGSPYLKRVEAAGLARDLMPAMGRRNAEFLHPGIGLMSDCSQRWVDRNFSLDYLLKSLEKISVGAERAGLRSGRALLKETSYGLLGRFLGSLGFKDPKSLPAPSFVARERLLEIMDLHFADLVAAMEQLANRWSPVVSPASRALLDQEFTVWSQRRSWALIND
jgi:hypothetical protein